ncbi:MAG: 2'-5' RNA ligase family protein [Gemmatimonadaceae bacterium]|nr:2'-5' RNA ligase family protein [Gemmatimonadaceae bacterium]
MRSGIYLILPLQGPARDQVLSIQERYDPRSFRGWPPHATLAGSSGMGPLDGDTPVPGLRTTLTAIAADSAPIEAPLEPPIRFMQTNVVVLPLDPHGPVRVLHERLRVAGLRYAPPRFAFTPHVTLSFFPELTPQRSRELLAMRVTSPARFTEIVAYRSFENRTSQRLMSIPLSG